MEELKKAFCEVDAILSIIEAKYVDNIPNKFKNLLKQQKDKEYVPKIDANIPLQKQKFLRKTLVILAILNLNFWCERETEKQKLIKMYEENDTKNEQEMLQKHNLDNLFEKKQNTKENEKTNCKELVEYTKANFWTKIFGKITSLLKINKRR